MEDDHLASTETHGGDAESSGQKPISHLEEPLRDLLCVTDELAVLGDIVECIEHGLAWNPHIVKHEPSIVDSIEADFPAHVLDHDTLAWLHLVVTDPHDEGVDALVFTAHQSLSKDDGIVGVASTVGDPELLGQGSWRVDHKLLGLLIIDSSGLHLWSIVSISQLSEAEASHVLERVNILQEWQVSLGMQSHQGATEKVELDGDLGGQVAIEL